MLELTLEKAKELIALAVEQRGEAMRIANNHYREAGFADFS